MESAAPTPALPETGPVDADPEEPVLLAEAHSSAVACTVARTGKEETNQTEPPPQGAGLVFVTGTEEDYKPETGTHVGKEHTGGNVVTQAPSLVSLTALSSPVPQSSVGFTVEAASSDPPFHHTPPSEAAELAGSRQDSDPSGGHVKELLENAAEISDAKGAHAANSLEAVERIEVLFETRPHPEVLETPKAKELLSGLYPEAPGGLPQTDSSPSSFGTLSEASKPSGAPALFDGGLVVSLQAGDVVKDETSHSIAALVHSASAQEIVVVREEAHISGAWTNVHLNQGYLLQREDGSVCQAAIELAAGGAVQAEVELDSQPMEVYEFCGLVEEVAEETVCGGGGGAQIPHSPGYEVNLFNALLENSDEFAVKEDLEGDAIIISQQALPMSGDLANSDSHGLQDAGVAAAAVQHMVLDQAVAHASEVCLLDVAAVTSEPLLQVSGSAVLRMVPAAAAAEPLSVQAPSLDPAAGVTVVSATKPEVCTSSCGGTKDTPNTQSQRVQDVAAVSKAKSCSTSPAGIDPKRLLLKLGETPLLKTPASLLAHVTKQQSVVAKLANAHSSGTVPEECLPCAAAVAAAASSSSAADGGGSNQGPCSQTAASESVPLQLHQTSEALTVTARDAAAPAAASPPHDPDSRGDSLSAGEECEDMEQDEAGRDTEAQEANSGQVSSPEEGSDDEADTDKSEMTSPGSPLKHGQSRPDRKTLFMKVRQWITDRVSINSSPISPSTSSPGYPGPSGPSDWSTPRREKSSPLRGPSGKFMSPSSLGGYSSATSPTDQSTPQRPRGERHTDMAELAKHEADIEHRTQALKREGFWSMKRLTRLTEPQKPKVHWDYLCEEMQWLSADFAQERRWKRGVARKVVRMVMRHHEDLRQKEEKAKRDEHAKIRRVASSIAKEVRAFWSNVEKVVQYKQQSRLEEKRKKALDLQLDFIVGQTEKYSDLLSKSLAPSRPADVAPTPQKSAPAPLDEDDRDFEPRGDEEDDEETIEVEEQQEGNDAETHRKEIELLKEEGLLPLDQLLNTLKLPQDLGSEEECSDETSSSAEDEEKQKDEEDEDGEFTANEEDAEDEEDTIAAQEKVEGNVNHAEELDDLAKEGDMSMEALLEKYKGAYASDFEAPSASASGSKASSDMEDSGDEEAETDEEESDVESNTSSSDSAGDSAEDEESEKEEEESEEGEEDECGDEGMEVLLKEGDHSPPSSSSRPKKEISHIAATAESLQPKGYTLATTKVKTPIPFLLHGTLREYQHIGLDWLVTMYEKKLNGILADEMGLGKTIQTIALLAHLACEKGNWGPHLIIVPTSVMLNWEMELKRWCPGFKILTYFGSQKERKLKRQGWTKPNAFHVCITSYKLVLQDHQAFRRKSWRYLILDEAQNIKNFKSQRWQSLLNFNSHRRLLLTGTPLQNSLMELWSLMHFLMPHVFQSHREFKEWFSNPLTGMIEGSQEYNEGLVKRLHKVLRPFLLRRIKIDVEKQMPKKYEHVVRCRLSKRQRFLYDDFMAQASTRETLASGHFMSVINILMQLRKVCNHPNLFDPRPIQSPFITQPIIFHTASLAQDALDVCPLKRCDLSMFNLVALERHVSRYQADVFLPRHKVSRQLIQEVAESPEPPPRPRPVRMKVNRTFQPPPKGDNRPVLLMNKPTCSVAPAAQTPKPTPVTEVASTSAPPPVIQQVVCSVAATPPPRLPAAASQTAVRSSAPKPVLTVRAPAAPCVAGVPSPSTVMPQRVLLSPDMQARLPSGEVVSIAQLASLAGRPVSSCQGSKPVTFQLQGNKLTLSGAQIHQVPAAAPRPVQGNVMHLVSSGVQHHLISQPAQVTVQTAASATAPNANRLPHNATSQVPSAMVSSPGVVKIVVRQSAGKEGGPVPTLAVAPSPRVTPQASSPSLHPHAAAATTATPIRTTAPLQITQRTAGPATAHYTIAPPRHPGSAPNQPQPPRPVLKVVQPPPPPPAASVEQPAPTPVTSSSSVTKPSSTPRDSGSSQTAVVPKSRPSVGGKVCPPARRVPRPPPRSPFHMSWLSDSLKRQRESRLDFIFGVNERRCGARPMYGREVLDLLTFLPGARPSPAPLRPEAEWGRSGHSSCLMAQTREKFAFWQRSGAVREAIHSVDERLELVADVIDRFTFAIPPVEAPPISMHCCHPPPSLSHREAMFSAMLATEAAPLTSSLHRIQCYMRTQFPDLRLIQYDCGKLQTLHTLLRKLKSGGHRVLIFTQMTRMLDVLEQFLNYHGHIYLRLDGSTRVEQRQALMERFNADRRIFCFILSTRSGGVGVNLTGADTVVFYDSDWNPTMDAQAQDRCHRIGQTRDVHIYRLISERTVEENILKKANQKRMLGDMAIEGGNFTTAFFKQQTIRELFDMNDSEKREAAVELSLPHAEEEEGVNKQSTTILEQALCRAEDEEDIVAASQAKAEQVAELAEFNENIPLDDGGGEQEEVEELSKAEQEIAALVEQLTPIERYAMNFLEASLEDVCKEELKQAEEQVEAARKGLDQAKEEGLKLHASSDDNDDDFLSRPGSAEPAQPPPSRRGRKPKDKTVTSTRTSGRLRGASPDTEPEPTTPREVPERLRGLRGRGAAKDTSAVSATPSHPKTSSSARLQDSKPSKASSPARDHHAVKTRTQPTRTHPSPVPSPTTASPPAGKHPTVGETESKNSKAAREEKDGSNERKVSESSLASGCPVDHQTKDDDSKDHSAMSPPSTSSRSPRKRQSADDEVLRGLVEDSPSAKVLRKLPGRLVTVVEEKEPRRRRRRGSGTGGSVEEAVAEETADDPNKDNTSPSNDGKTKTTVTKSPQDQDPTPSPSVVPQPVRSYPSYSAPHLSPDMPVLRNLPVRRRLETESRMAAQLGEQQQLLGRGRGGNQSKKTDSVPGKETALSSAESSLNSLATPLKRKRGRPPKTPPRLPESDNTISPLPTSPSEEENPPVSPKRKRGRPRKDSVTVSDATGEGQNSEASATSKLELSSHSVPSETLTPVAANTNMTSPSTKEETDTKTEDSNAAPNQALVMKTDEACKPISSVQTPATLEPPPVPTSTHSLSAAQEAQTSSASFVPLSSCTDVIVTTTSPSPSTNIVSSTAPTSVVATAAEAAVEPGSSALTVKMTGQDSNSARPTTVAPPAATTLPAVAVEATLTGTSAGAPGFLKPATTTVKSLTTKAAAVKDPTKSSVASAATTTHATPKVSSPSLSPTSPKSTSSTSAPVMTTQIKPAQLNPTKLAAQVKTAQVIPSNATTVKTPQTSLLNPTAVEGVQTNQSNPTTTITPPQVSPSKPTTTAKTIQTSQLNLATTVKAPQACPSNPTGTIKTVHVGPSNPTTAKTPQAITSVKEKPAQACSSNPTVKTTQTTPSVSTTQTKLVQACPSKSAAPTTVRTNQVNASPAIPKLPSVSSSVTNVNIAPSLPDKAKTNVTDGKTSTAPLATEAPAPTRSTKEPLKSGAAPPLPICSAAPTTSVPTPSTPVPAPTTSAPTPSTPVSAPTTSVPTPSAPVSAAPTTSAPTPSAPVSAPTTSVPTPSAPVSAPTTSVPTPSTPVSAPTTSVSAPSPSVSAPTTSVSAPSTSVSAPTTSVPAPSAPVSAPTTSVPSTPLSTPTTSVPAPSTTVLTSSEANMVASTSSPQTEAVLVTSPSELDTSGSPLVATPEEKTTETPVTTPTGVPQTVSTPKMPSVEKLAADESRNCTATQVCTATCTTAAPPVSTTQTTTVHVPSPGSTAVPAPAPPGGSSETQSAESVLENSKSDSEMEVDAEADSCKETDDNKQTGCKSQPKRRKVASSSGTKESKAEKEEEAAGDAKVSTTLQKDQSPQSAEKTNEDQKPPRPKRSLSRQSSQDSTRSSSPSSGCSTSTLTRHAHHKRTYENRLPAKKKRTDVTSEAGKEENEESGERNVDGSEKESTTSTSRSARRSRSSSSSTDSESDETRKENRLTRSAKRRLQDQEKDKGTKERKASKPADGSDKSTSNTTNTSTGGESGSDTSSVRIKRKSAVSQPSQDGKAQTNSTPPLPPEPEVLGKRCSALNAAAKLLAMKGRVDTPGHTTRRDPGAKSAASADKNQKSKNKAVPTSPQNNSVSLNNNKNSSSKPSAPNQTSRPPSRSTRQCPGSLVPPLEAEYKRLKPEEKERGGRKPSGAKDGEAEGRSSSRGHSACSSMSSDGEGDCGGRSSRSRSSSNSSRRTHSISSQNTERRGSRSRAASSGSERDRSLDRAKRDQPGRRRESRKDGRRVPKPPPPPPPEAVTSGSGNEGTPDRVLRSVAALAAVQARSPAASTRSSSSHQRHNKT